MWCFQKKAINGALTPLSIPPSLNRLHPKHRVISVKGQWRTVRSESDGLVGLDLMLGNLITESGRKEDGPEEALATQGRYVS